MKTRVSDPSTLLGILAAFTLIGIAIHIGGSPKAFFDVPSVLIVVLGTLAVATACYSFSDLVKSFITTLRTIIYHAEDPSESAKRALEIAGIAKKKGLLQLETHLDLTKHNPMFYKAISVVIDGMQPEHVEDIMNQEIYAMNERHTRSVSVLKKCAEVAPAMGLIGTLIGLVQMLGNLDDPGSIGPAMAVALLTTFYGAILAYLVFSPLASKLERNSRGELMIAEIYKRAASSIARGENPRQLEIMLNSILPPAKRVNVYNNSYN